MSKNLLIVESPAKAKTIQKYLGEQFSVLASYGHVRDLPAKKGAVDTEHDFAMSYQVIDRNKKHVDAIASALKSAEALYLATDPDREGEAIAWHLCELMKSKKLLQDKPIHRVVFHEITKSAIKTALQEPREVSMPLVNAQQARRALDYLVGFNLSPLLWKKIRRGLSAGRVQSPALRLIVEREKEISDFISREYWSIEADLAKEAHLFSAKLVLLKEEKLKQFDITQADQASDIRAQLLAHAKGELIVSHIEKKQRKRNPPPPFTTSTLQQDAHRALGFSAKKTMQIAQQLYEGVEVQEGHVGLISYMRTDSVSLSAEAISEIRQYIQTHFGQDNLPPEARIFKTQSKNAQEAHEAIRPTSAFRAPADIKNFLSPDQFKLYNLIWKRTLASQMMHATIDTVSVDLACAEVGVFRATGSTLLHPGYLRLYQETADQPQEDDKEARLPAMVKGEAIQLMDIRGEQHFTEPPPRYTEASLVKTLEEHGIGRPSTYASIISTLQQREYVTLEAKRFKPTDVGVIVNKFLTDYFTQYVDYDFTAALEDDLDKVARGETQWIPLLESFWKPFEAKVGSVEETVKRADVTQEKLDEACPKCTKPLAIRLGRLGRFVGCSGYPECKYTRKVEGSAEDSKAEFEPIPNRTCPKCQGALHIRPGRYGKFIGCGNYPSCDFIEPLNKPIDTGIVCPVCQEGHLMQRKSRYGKVFFGCNKYPGCKYALWNPPLAEPCPKCDFPILTQKTTKRRGVEKVCPKEGCGFVESCT